MVWGTRFEFEMETCVEYTWKLFGSWYGWPPISSISKPSGNITAARQKRTTIKQIHYLLTDETNAGSDHLLAVNPTHLAYGITSRSQLLDANKIIAVVMHIQPTNMQMSASSHSGCNSGVKHTCGRLYNVMHVHMRPSRVSPKTIPFILMNNLIFSDYMICNENKNITTNVCDYPVGHCQTYDGKYIGS